MKLSIAEENYLKAIFKIYERSQQSASTNSIAQAMSTSPASVTDMVKKLADKGYVKYERYKGSTLTAQGNRAATHLIRKHRLWEVFLVSKLRFSWDQVHDIAEQLEHIRSEDLVLRLDAFLDYPRFDPHGDPIPNSQGKFTIRNQTPLSELHAGQKGVLVGVRDHTTAFLQYLDSLSIKLGVGIKVVDQVIFDGSYKVIIDHGEETMISSLVAQNLLIKKQ